MEDLGPIHAAVARARRRLRLQAALDATATAAPLGAVVALGGVVCMRLGLCSGRAASIAAAVACGAVVVGAGVAAAWPRDAEAVARRLDRAAGLCDRLSTSLALARERRDRDAVGSGLVRLAIADGVRAAAAADPRSAVPIRRPRDAGIAAISVLVALLVAGIAAHRGVAGVRVPAAPRSVAWHREGAKAAAVPGIARADVDYLRREIGRLRASRTATGGDDRGERELQQIEEELDNVERGELDAVGLLDALGAATRRGHVGGLEDVLEAARHSRPPEPVPPTAPPAPPPPPEPGQCSPSGPTGIGALHDPGLAGPPSRTELPTRDRRVSAPDDGAVTRRQTVKSAAQHGFAGHAYQRVFAEYTSIVEEVMRAEEVPPSHRYLVVRYFDRIRPW